MEFSVIYRKPGKVVRTCTFDSFASARAFAVAAIKLGALYAEVARPAVWSSEQNPVVVVARYARAEG